MCVFFECFCLVLKVFSRMSLGELETFITEQEEVASRADPEQEESPEQGEVLEVRLGEKGCPEPGTDGSRPLGSLGHFFLLS